GQVVLEENAGREALVLRAADVAQRFEAGAPAGIGVVGGHGVALFLGCEQAQTQPRLHALHKLAAEAGFEAGGVGRGL
nr:hypothetical protein [Tanacetum cinerariifolium]